MSDPFILRGVTRRAAPTDQTIAASPDGSMVVSSRYQELAQRGQVFHGLSVVGGNSFVIYSATALTFALWNKSTTHNLELIRFTAGYVSGTGVAGPFGYSFKTDAGFQAATGSPVAAFADASSTGIKNAILGLGNATKATLSNAATTTIVAAPTTNFIPGNMSHLVTTAADATNVPFIMEDNINGSIIVPPGCLIFPSALLASVSLFTMKFTWAEVPIANQ